MSNPPPGYPGSQQNNYPQSQAHPSQTLDPVQQQGQVDSDGQDKGLFGNIIGAAIGPRMGHGGPGGFYGGPGGYPPQGYGYQQGYGGLGAYPGGAYPTAPPPYPGGVYPMGGYPGPYPGAYPAGAYPGGGSYAMGPGMQGYGMGFMSHKQAKKQRKRMKKAYKKGYFYP